MHKDDKNNRGVRPPWIQCPNISCTEIWWRMGPGEGYINRYLTWVSELSANDRREHIITFCPIPDDWRLFASEIYALPEVNESALDEAFEIVYRESERQNLS